MSRVAVYVRNLKVEPAGLMHCTRHARASGDRIVAVCSEPCRLRRPPHDSTLVGLVERMQAGEFEAIVALLSPEWPTSDVFRLTLSGPTSLAMDIAEAPQ